MSTLDNEDNSTVLLPKASTIQTTRHFQFGNHCTVAVIEEASSLIETHAVHVWPSAIVMCCYLMKYCIAEDESSSKSKSDTVFCELGCGCALPSLLCAKLGYRTIMTDRPVPNEASWKHKMMMQCSINAISANFELGAETGNRAASGAVILPLTWGKLEDKLIRLSKHANIRYLLGSDCFYDSSLFEPLIFTVSFILEEQRKRNNLDCEFITTYHERVDSYSLQHLLNKWNLQARIVPPSQFLSLDLYKHIYQATNTDNHGNDDTDEYNELCEQKYQEALHSIHTIIITLKCSNNSDTRHNN